MKFGNDLCVKAWVDRHPNRVAFSVVKRFHAEVLSKHPKFGSMAFSEIVEWQINARGREAYEVKSLAQQWVNRQNLRIKSKQSYLSHISSVFLHNHAPLPADPSFHFTSDKPAVEGKLTFDAFKRILLNSNKMYRAVFMFMAATLAGEGEFVYVNTHYCEEVLEALTRNKGVVKLVLPGRKRNRNIKNFYVMFNTRSDCGDALRDYLKSCSELPRGVLFRNSQGKPVAKSNIRKYFHRRAVEAGIVKQASPNCRECGGETLRTRKRAYANRIVYVCRECGVVEPASNSEWKGKSVRYGVNPHEIRDLMRSRWQVSGADPLVAEFVLGHDVDPNAYNKFVKYEPWYPIREYKKALGWLNILTQDPAKVDRSEIDSRLEAREAEIDVLRREMAELKRDQRDYHDILEVLRDPDKMREFKRLLTLPKKKEKGS